MQTADFDYHLPPELIAQEPVEPRDASRLLVLGRTDGAVAHRRFADLPELLRPDDLLVANDSRVHPARLYGTKPETGGRIELLLLREHTAGAWEALVRPARRVRAGTTLALLGRDGTPSGLAAHIGGALGAGRAVHFDAPAQEVFERCGHVPLPPYIHRRLDDPERYQTVYAAAPGSAAAPTAGLHFTPRLLERLRARGVEFALVTLHVGLDTFRPVTEERPQEHAMHSERIVVPAEAAEAISRTKQRGGRVVAVGTTAVRTLEAAAIASPHGQVEPYDGSTDLYILPGFTFRVVDALITNFHLPRSTLLMLVSAFASRERVLAAYAEAIRERYRFYSFGDAMLIC
jgi:S-adenosylmethionine:tRNA ribosyltransferase-isomerase